MTELSPMRRRRARTIVVLAPVLIAVLVAVSATGCERDPGPPAPRPATPVADALAGAGVSPAALATPHPIRWVSGHSSAVSREPLTSTSVGNQGQSEPGPGARPLTSSPIATSIGDSG